MVSKASRQKANKQKTYSAQHRVHPTGGSRRVFRQVAWLEVGSIKVALSPPAHPQVTHPVGRQIRIFHRIKEKA